jgi:hypothetical protein
MKAQSGRSAQTSVVYILTAENVDDCMRRPTARFNGTFEGDCNVAVFTYFEFTMYCSGSGGRGNEALEELARFSWTCRNPR